MRKWELDRRVASVLYDANNSTSVEEEVSFLLRRLDEAERLNKILCRAVMVGEEQLSGETLVEYIGSDIKQMRYALTKAKKQGIDPYSR